MIAFSVRRLAEQNNLRFGCGRVVLGICFLMSGCTRTDSSGSSGRSPRDVSAEASASGRTVGLATSARTLARFVDVTQDSGLIFSYRNGQEAGVHSIVESLGGGVALFDIDADGWLDVMLPGGGEFPESAAIQGLPPGLFRQRSPWRFDPAGEQAGTNVARFYSHGASAADFNNDGFRDVLITGYGGLLLFQNQGDGTFMEIAQQAGLADTLWSSSAAWGDLDKDGELDLYVAHYVNWSFDNHPNCPGPAADLREICSPRQFEPLPDACYLNDGNGLFHDSSAVVGLRTDGKGLGVVIADIDIDGNVDVYVGNDTVPNFLYRGDGHGKLIDASVLSGASLNQSGTPDGSMGVDVADYNADGMPDIWVANYERESFALYRNEGNCFFRHISQSSGITAVQQLAVGWGTNFLDFDRDGDEDIVTSNGHVIRYPDHAELRQLPFLFENEDHRRFFDAAPFAGSWFTQPHMGRGLATGDLDNDGDVDIVFVNTNEPTALLSNESDNPNGWIGFRLIGSESNRDAIGARVEVITSGGAVAMKQIRSGGSYASTSDNRLFFGLGRFSGTVGARILWPSGKVLQLENLKPRNYYNVVERGDIFRLANEGPSSEP